MLLRKWFIGKSMIIVIFMSNFPLFEYEEIGARDFSSTHREMIPGGKLLGMALVSTQKALSLVQEQVAGHRGVLGALRPTAVPNIQRSSTQTDSRQSSHRGVHLGLASTIFHLLFSSLSCLSQETQMAGWSWFLSVPINKTAREEAPGCEWETWGGVRLRRDGHRESGQWLVFPGCVYEGVFDFLSVLCSLSLSLCGAAVRAQTAGAYQPALLCTRSASDQSAATLTLNY